jgi:transposase
MRHVLGCLARRWLEWHEKIKVHTRHLAQRTNMVAPGLIAGFGDRSCRCAGLLLAAGDNTDRIRSGAAFASCAICLIPHHRTTNGTG